MISGFERYYQIARCFRDEDLRADRQPEFTQLDVETSFLSQEEIMQIMEGLLRQLFRVVMKLELPDPFPRLTYGEAMRRYGSDKPDLRIALELVDVHDLVTNCDFKVFAAPAKDPKGRVTALRVPGGGAMPRSQIDEYTAFVGRYGAKGLAYIKVNEAARGRDGLQSPIVKFLDDAAVAGILERTGAQDNDLIFFGADKAKVVSDALGALRLKVAQDLKAREGGLAAAVGRRLPDVRIRRRREALGRRAPSVHCAEESRSGGAEGRARRRARAGVRHRAERLGSGRRFGAYLPAGAAVDGVRHARHRAGRGEAQVRFPARRAALRCAAARWHRVRPRPARHAHGGSGQHPRRHRVPKTQTAADPLTEAPTEVSEQQLRELHIRVRKSQPAGPQSSS